MEKNKKFKWERQSLSFSCKLRVNSPYLLSGNMCINTGISEFVKLMTSHWQHSFKASQQKQMTCLGIPTNPAS